MDQVSTINMKALEKIDRIQVRNETLISLLHLYESKGKTFYYDELFKRDYDAFVNKTLEEDVKQIALMLKLDLTDARVKYCSKREFSPKNKDEQLLYNIKKVLTQIQKNIKKFELISNEALELAKMISKDYENISWNRYQSKEEGLMRTSNTVSLREKFDELILMFNNLMKEDSYELTHLITNFYIDFINMDVFNKQNELIALIFLYTMLYKYFEIFSYVSFFKYFNEVKSHWDYALTQANYNWKSGYAQTDTLTEILYQILIEAYKEVEDLAYTYEFEKDLNKSDSVENTILKFDRLFSKAEIRKAHPTVSDSTIDRTLARLKEEDKIRPIGVGRGAKWQVINQQKVTSFAQMSIFENK